VTLAEHGVSGDPVYVTGAAGHVTAVVLGAIPIVKFFESLLPVWFASPPKVADAVAVPAFVLLV